MYLRSITLGRRNYGVCSLLCGYIYLACLLPASAVETSLVRSYSDESLHFTVTADKTQALVAENFNLTFLAQYPEGCTVGFPYFGSEFGGLTLAGRAFIPPKLIGFGRVQETVNLVLAPYLSGDFLLPELQVKLLCSGVQSAAVLIDEIKLTVVSLVTQDGKATELRDIAGVIGKDSIRWPLVFVLAALVICGAAATILWHRKKKPVGTSPADTALQELDALSKIANDPMAELPECFARLSEVMRLFISQQCGVDAIHYTTEEFCGEQGRALYSQHRIHLWQILQGCDEVKFSRANISAELFQKHIATAIQLIQGLSPSQSYNPSQMLFHPQGGTVEFGEHSGMKKR